MNESSVPKAGSLGEEAFALHCRLHRLKPKREFRFAAPRRWRFDFAFPESMLAVEIEGGTWKSGRHSRGAGMEADMEKYNAAAMLGWTVLRFSTSMVTSGAAIAGVVAYLRQDYQPHRRK